MMRFFFVYGIIPHFLLMVTCGKRDCGIVKDVYKKEHWDGTEENIYIHVMKTEVVNIKFTYQHLEDKDFFTILYLSPNISSRYETKDGEEFGPFPLKDIKTENGWGEIEVSSEGKTIMVKYTKSRQYSELIHINQSSTSFHDLTIRASNISFCKNEKQWNVSSTHPAFIPLGIEHFDMKFHSKQSHYSPMLKLNDWNMSLPIDKCTEYRKFNEENYSILQCNQNRKQIKRWKKNETNVIVMSTIEEFGFITTLTFDQDLPSSQTATPKPFVGRSSSKTESCTKGYLLSGFIPAIIIVSVFLIIVLTIYRKKHCRLRTRFEKCIGIEKSICPDHEAVEGQPMVPLE